MTETITTTERIARLNDQLRQGDTKIGEIRITQAVKALIPEQQQKLLQLLRDFNSFEAGNNPYGERDFLSIQLDSKSYFFKIDYFDKKAWLENQEIGSECPEDPDKTWRVATLMQSNEY
ncbi:DUF3768 domain-containing protein [Lyngbya sp. CCAP 1446/10]|uniref:DUF3768 domain-containing protein n=1 Tax=Lyngbya sp. CCAP 1446/10 TaxID=439293 RepID=UPI002237D31C|nr:DUF3768 domain-containing protein [Lyngbya sp. CCAP 1446/10]MCW6053252.1 DUF3768 domain-containing protein [Lyngbya sp. CCAP 1446/10]